jgi:hypothetical protein
MNSTISTKTNTLSYIEYLAHSLIDFAQKHESFASWLSGIIPHTKETHREALCVVGTTPFRIIDEPHGVARAQWLMEVVMQKQLPASKEALKVLQTWGQSRERTEPKAVVLGVKYGVLPIGILGNPKVKNHPMNVVVSDDVISRSTKTSLLQDTTTLSHTIVAESLIRARGNMGHIEPELNDWLFGEKYLRLFSAKQNGIAKLLRYVKEWDIPHSTRSKDDRTTHIALHPVLYLGDVPFASELKKMKT